MSPTLRWGILGTGNIARQFAGGVAGSRRGRVTAVASRAIDAAQAFAAAHGVPHAIGGYAALLDRADVDAVYVSLPNHLHHEWTIAALRAGKHVLCEKPLALDAGQAIEMFDVAARERRLLMEAFMYRCHPLTAAVTAAVRGGAIGEPKLVRTSFCFRVRNTAGNVRFDRTMGGGCLMDVGCYCVNFSRLIAGCEPADVSAVAHFHDAGVDDLTAGTLAFPTGLLATFACGMTAQADNTATVNGTEGYIDIPIPWKPPASDAIYTVSHGIPPRMDTAAPPPSGRPPRETFTVDAPGPLYGLEADAFAAAVLDGAAVPVTRDDSIGNMRVLDALRGLIGLRFSP